MLSTAISVLKDIIKIKVDHSTALKLNELLHALIEAQTVLASTQQQLIERNNEIRKLKDAVLQKKNYVLCNVGFGGVAYMSKLDAPTTNEVGEVGVNRFHYTCQHCFDTQAQRVVLQPNAKVISGNVINTLVCHACHSEILLENPVKKLNIKIHQSHSPNI